MTEESKPPSKDNQNPLKSERNFKNYAKFLVIAILLMLVADYVLWPDGRPHITKMKEQYAAEQAEREALLEQLLPPLVTFDELQEEAIDLDELFPLDLLGEDGAGAGRKMHSEPKKVRYKKKRKKVDKAQIAIVIDDMGMNRKQSFAAIDLPAKMSLAFLPYAPGVKEMAAQAKEKGHALMLHAPMEAMSNKVDLGDLALTADMSALDFNTEFEKMVAAFDGYDGVNNHMGSKLTRDHRAMALLMMNLKRRDLFFLDSRTIGGSVAPDMAQRFRVPYAVRDVFIDHHEDPESVNEALWEIERIAAEYGSAIAIGHPKKVTIDALKEWIPEVEKAGYEFVFVGNLLEQ